MPDPRPPASPRVPTDAATGEWSSVTAREPKGVDSPTVTSSGQRQPFGSEAGIPNPFGRYQIVRLLGRGGMGSVYLAHDAQLDRPVALKIPSFRGTPSPEQKERFSREARAVAALHHPNLCPVYDVDEEQGILYLTTQFIDGQPLSTVLKVGPLPPMKAAELVRRVALAMEAAHEHGTIHRDLKPANIMIDRAGEPVVMDFGLARKGESDDEAIAATATSPVDISLTQMGSVLGTPAYMPPEQAVGNLTAIGPRSDVYSLGAVLYECLTGRRPFDGPDTASVIEKILHLPPPRPRDFISTLEAGLERVCLKALAKEPAERFASMADFAAALENIIDPKLEVVLPPPLPPDGRKFRQVKIRRWTWPLTCLAVSLAFVLVCVGGPTLAIWLIIGRVKDTFKEVKEIAEAQQQSSAEWDAIIAIWQPPAADADTNALFPLSIPGGYSRKKIDEDAADAELGLALSGRRAVYFGPKGETVEIRAFRCSDAEAKSIQATAQAFITSVKNGRGSVNRQKVVYTADNSGQRTFTFGFSDALNRNHEYGKIWYGGDWLFYFRTDTALSIEFFPPKYLLEVGKQAASRPNAKNGK
jgi:serine/threonine protein kinase